MKNPPSKINFQIEKLKIPWSVKSAASSFVIFVTFDLLHMSVSHRQKETSQGFADFFGKIVQKS